MPISAPKIPDGLPELMRGLAKSVIKENPDNLYVHAAEYFENLIRERDGHLDHGYSTFNAYQAYADYKEKTREKLGLTKDPSLSDGNGGDGDESGSAGSEGKLRGRKRRRARKPTSRERDNPATMVSNPSVSDEGEPQKLKSLSEESAPVPVVEQEVVKVHYNPPEATPRSPGRVVSAQSVEAEQAVSSILDDEQILDSDGTGGKETGDELVDNGGDDLGTAPSTAEITEQPSAPNAEAVPSGEMPLQDMETCFVHVNVDDLLEKHEEDRKLDDDNGLENVPEKTKVSSDTIGEDIPEGPQAKEEMKLVADEEPQQMEGVGKESENETQKGSVMDHEIQSETTSVPLEDAVLEKVSTLDGNEDNDKDIGTIPTPVEEAGLGEASNVVGSGDDDKDIVTTPVPVEEAGLKETPSHPGSEDNGNDKEDKLEKSLEQQPEQNISEAKEIKESFEDNSNHSDSIDKPNGQAGSNGGVDTVDVVEVDTIAEQEKTTEPNESSQNQANDEPIPSLPTNDIKTESPITPPVSKVESEEDTAAESPKEDSLTISPRMGFEDDEALDETVEAATKSLTSVVDETENPETDTKLPESDSTVLQEVKEIIPPIESKEQENESAMVDDNDGASLNELHKTDKDIQAEQDQGLTSEAKAIESQEQPEADNVQPASNIEKSETKSEEVQQEAKEQLSEDKSNEETNEQIEPKIDSKNESEENVEESNATESSNIDTKEDEKEENKVSIETKAEVPSFAEEAITVSIEDKSTTLSEPVPDPVNEQESTSEQQGGDTCVEKSDDAKNEIEVKKDPFSIEGNDQEVNKENIVTDANDLLTKDRSLEDVVEAPDATASGTEVPSAATNSEVIVEDTGPTQAPSIDDNMNKTTEKTNEGMVSEEAKECPATDNEEGEIKEDTKKKEESEQEEIEGQTDSVENAEENKKSADDLVKDEIPNFESVVVDELQKLIGDATVLQEEKHVEVSTNDVGKTAADITETSHDEPTKMKSTELLIGTKSDDVAVEGVAPEADAATADVAESKGSSGDHAAAAASPDNTPLVSLKSDVETPEREGSLEEVVEEPCVKREIIPSKTASLEKGDSTEKQVVEREEIKKVDLSQLSKDSAEALFYSLKKSELENQEPGDGGDGAGKAEQPATAETAIPTETADDDADDDEDVVVKEEPASTLTDPERTKRTFTDDFLDEAPITDAATTTITTLPSDGAAAKDTDPLPTAGQDRISLEADEQKDEFNPMVMVSMRSKQFQDQLHGRGAGEAIIDEQAKDAPARRPIMRRCMTEMSGLQRFDAAAGEEDTPDTRPDDPSYVEEEDQFDGYYIGHIKNKILASSVSVADSDCPDGTRSSVESIDENNVRTALETIASTDTESTIASQATIQQAGPRSYLRKHSQNASSNIPYASFGNAAIDQSLDEFIEREEQHKQDEAMAEAATKIQRSYRTHKKKLLRDYHSTMRTFTEDQSAESGGEEYAANVIQIKLDQRRADRAGEEANTAGGDAGEESDTGTASHQPLGGATGRRPMYSLNIVEYDTVARRMTLTRGVAMQRNSTPEDDSGKSSNVSTDRKPSLAGAATTVQKDSMPASGESGGDSPSSDEKPPAPAITQPPGDEREPRDGTLSSARSKPKSGPPAGTVVTGREHRTETVPRPVASRTSFAPLDVQNLLLIARQRTMPVQIDSSVIRVLPKHMRKRISSAGVPSGNGKRK